MCELDATSIEHVPPKAIFPEAKDIGADYRKNLITVPSCDLHNMGKSHDDEFLMVSLAGIIGNNSIGYHHQLTKVDRALRRTSFALLKKVFLKKPVLHQIDLGSNRFLQVLWGTPDQARLRDCFARVARGIHYNHFGTAFFGQVKPLIGYLAHEDQSTRNLYRFLIDRAELDLADQEKFGKNQSVFFYQVTQSDEFGLFLIRLCFYGGLSVFCALIPEGASVPYNLGFELMKKGIKTVFTLGDKAYEIN
jgi:hypothetical protein